MYVFDSISKHKTYSVTYVRS